jgi:hypothetical protein
MKVEKIEQKPKEEFVPFNLKITIETKEDAQALYAIFNHGHNRQLFDIAVSENIKNIIGFDHFVGNDDDIISRGVCYKRYYIR